MLDMDTNKRPLEPTPAYDPDIYALVRFALLFGVAIILATLGPAALFPASLSSLLFVAAMASATIALVQRHRLFAEHFTRWDEAAGFYLLSTLASLFVDPVALEAALAAARNP